MEANSPIRQRRHFPYKHPTFGTPKRPKSEAAWKGSVYYWWWAYLRRNQKYLDCCDLGGKGPLASLYEAFGDVRDDDFKKWWFTGERGANLFAEKPVEESFKVIPIGDSIKAKEGSLTLVIPLNLPKRFLLARFNEVLTVQHKGKRGYQKAKESKLTYRIKGQPNLKALELGLKVYDMVQQNPKMALWEVGNSIPELLKVQKIKKGDTPSTKTDKKRRITIIVSRYLSRTKGYIENTGAGCFV